MIPPSTDADLAAKKAEFFAKLPDPPAHDASVVDAASEEKPATKPAPKDAPVEKSAGASKDTPAADSPAVASDAPLADRVVAALKAGDLDALAELTDQDPAAFDEKSTKWAARNRREQKLKAELAKVKSDAEAVVEHYAPIDERIERFQATRDYALVAQVVELLTGEAWSDVRAQLDGVPGRKDVEGRVAALVERRGTDTKAEERVLREAIRDDLPDDHQVRALPDWEERVVAVLRESVDEVTGEPELSFKQAAQRVVRRAKDEHARLAKAFGGGAAPARPAGQAPERAAGAAPATKRKVTREEFFATFSK